jgi:hypothetical protein
MNIGKEFPSVFVWCFNSATVDDSPELHSDIRLVTLLHSL